MLGARPQGPSLPRPSHGLRLSLKGGGFNPDERLEV